jgi:SAM-dependent methyltransferase
MDEHRATAPAYAGTDNLEVLTEAIKYNRFLTDLIRGYARRDDRVLDFGAGIGTFAKQLSAEGLHIRCLEPDTGQAEILAASNLPVATSMRQIGDASIDLIYTFNVLEHIEDDLAALRECYRALKPNGRFLIYVPAFQMLYSSMDRKVGHRRRYTKRELTQKLRRAGFAIRKARYADSLGFFASLLYLAIGSDSGKLNRTAVILYDRMIFPVSRLLDAVCGGFFGKNVVVFAEKLQGSMSTLGT